MGDPAGIGIVLINPYELGRQPFGLAEPAAWLARDGHRVHCIDLSIERLDSAMPDGGVDLVCLYVAMHTATRIAIEAMPRIRALAPGAHLCVYGLYAPMNAGRFRELGADTVLGGEVEPALCALARRLAAGAGGRDDGPVVHLAKIPFAVPDRSTLPPLHRYARLLMPDGTSRTAGFAETTRGCKHLCRHCPVVPVYQGTFRVVPVEVVIADIRQQVAAGARHISFGDPDFLNGPAHARRVLEALAREFPDLSYDVTIKIEHIVSMKDFLPVLRDTGCLFLTAAVESVDDRVLERLDKGHTQADFRQAVELLRRHDIALAPTFVPFTPWTTLDSYIELLDTLVELDLVASVAPIQLAIRLLVPEGSWLFRLPGFDALVGGFDPVLLGYPWSSPDPRVDALQRAVQALVADAEQAGRGRIDTFAAIRALAYAAAGRDPAPLPELETRAIPGMSEPWYCCAEPTEQQLTGF